uniref:Patched domain-containing protein 1 n=1 Tax=Caenorhabditis tropicalis TaxID=1561998 RepID=A0A1I7T078_9PELO
MKAFQEKTDKAKVRRAYALGGCLMFIWISTHGLLLYKRRSEYRNLNEKLPPISWEQFETEYLATGEVKTIIFQPHFETANVYLHSAREQQMKKNLVNLIHTTPDKFSRPPDVRFHLEASAENVEALVTAAAQKYKHHVDFELDRFPSYRELSFIVGSSLFVLAAITMAK